MEDLQSQLTTLPGVSRTLFASPNANVDTGAVWLIPETGQNDPATWELVRQIRAHAQQWQQLWGISIQVSGPAANYVDVAERIAAATWPIAVTLTITLLVLLLVTAGAFWPALASLAGCVLSIAAALGSAKLFFNDGLLASGVNTPGPIDVCLPLLGGGLFAGLGTAVAIAANAWFIEIHSAKPAPMALSPQVHLKQPIAMPDSAVKRSVLPGAYLRTIVIAAIAIFICFIPTGNATVRQFAFFWAAGTVFGFFWIKFAMAPIAERLFSSKRLRWLPAWLRARVFKLDMTGEKLANLESALIEYSNNEYLEALPNSEGSGGICATDLTVQIEGNLLFPPTSLDIPAGEVVAIIGNAFWAKVLLYGLAGRVQLTGTGSVNGYRLGDESWSIRKTSKIIDVETPISEYCKWPQLVIVEGIDIFPQDKLAAIETAIASTLPAIADTSGSQAHAESIGSVDVSFPSTTHQSAGENSGTVTWLLSSVQPPPLFFSYCIDLDAENVSVDATGSANRQEL
jgi:RND superfamily putative drug exporter